MNIAQTPETNSCIKRRPYFEELLNQILEEIARGQTIHLFASKIDLAHVYGEMKSEETSRFCVIAITGAKFRRL